MRRTSLDISLNVYLRLYKQPERPIKRVAKATLRGCIWHRDSYHCDQTFDFQGLQGGAERVRNMAKKDLITEVSRAVEITRKESEVIVESIFTTIVKVLRSGDKIEIRGFGSFRTRLRQPRMGRNPKTGARVEVPVKRIPYFKS